MFTIKNNVLRFLLIATLQLQVLFFWVVIRLWQTIGPIVGLPGLILWMGSGYWLANRMERQTDQRFLEELKRRGWKPPPNA
jgi:hypothetical protein